MLRGSSASITFYRPSSLTKTILGSANEIVTVQPIDSSIPCELKLRHLVVGGQEHVFFFTSIVPKLLLMHMTGMLVASSNTIGKRLVCCCTGN